MGRSLRKTAKNINRWLKRPAKENAKIFSWNKYGNKITTFLLKRNLLIRV